MESASQSSSVNTTMFGFRRSDEKELARLARVADATAAPVVKSCLRESSAIVGFGFKRFSGLYRFCLKGLSSLCKIVRWRLD
jgi:hypothetical protein